MAIILLSGHSQGGRPFGQKNSFHGSETELSLGSDFGKATKSFCSNEGPQRHSGSIIILK